MWVSSCERSHLSQKQLDQRGCEKGENKGKKCSAIDTWLLLMCVSSRRKCMVCVGDTEFGGGGAFLPQTNLNPLTPSHVWGWAALPPRKCHISFQAKARLESSRRALNSLTDGLTDWLMACCSLAGATLSPLPWKRRCVDGWGALGAPGAFFHSSQIKELSGPGLQDSCLDSHYVFEA